jgi:predicted small lipoprotein YifL
MQGACALTYSDRLFLRLALIGALAASIGLAACGRKGPLDPPPGTSLTGGQSVPAGEEAKDAGRPILGSDGKPIASGGTNKRIPLDVLLN